MRVTWTDTAGGNHDHIFHGVTHMLSGGGLSN